MRGSAIAIAIVLGVLGCAPVVDGPVERQRAADRDDATALGAQLAKLPGAASATVTLHRPARDPLGVAQASPAAAAVLIVIDDAADRAQITSAATTLVRAAAPEISDPAIVVLVGVHRPTMAKVGPFVVDAGSAPPLKVALAVALLLVLALASWIAIRERQRA